MSLNHLEQGGNTFKFKQNDKILTKNHSSDFDMCSSPLMDQFFCVKILFFSCMRLSTDENIKKLFKTSKMKSVQSVGKIGFFVLLI